MFFYLLPQQNITAIVFYKQKESDNEKSKTEWQTTLNRLRKVGFEIGDYTIIVVSEGALVIQKEENAECLVFNVDFLFPSKFAKNCRRMTG